MFTMTESQTKLIRRQPLSRIEWVPRNAIRPNDYNPNRQPPPEARLLRVSILEDGWTQPIVVFDAEDGTKPVIVDGEHRWHTAASEEVAALTDGFVPIVRITGDVARRMMATVRHNRARGEHAVLPMAEIVRKLLEKMPRERVMLLLQMESEEVDRLAERAGMPDVMSRKKTEFGEGWVPG